MPRLTAEEREARRRKVQDEALEAVAARGQFNFRLDGSDIKRLYELAGMRKRPVSAMVREWVLDRLELEEGGKTQSPPWVQSLENRLSHTEVLIVFGKIKVVHFGTSGKRKWGHLPTKILD